LQESPLRFESSNALKSSWLGAHNTPEPYRPFEVGCALDFTPIVSATMKTISGLFDTHAEARRAVSALEEAGVNDVSIVSPEEHASSEGTAAGAGIGAAVGGVGGLLAGLGTFAIPGIGPVVGAGWLVTTLIGAAAGGAAGGILGSLTEAGIDEDEAHVYAESIKRGGTLVTARVDETEAEAAEAILNQYGPVDIGSRRAEFEAGGWSGFDDEYEQLVQGDEDRELRDPVVAPYLPR
jgi:hypothetical protein